MLNYHSEGNVKIKTQEPFGSLLRQEHKALSGFSVKNQPGFLMASKLNTMYQRSQHTAVHKQIFIYWKYVVDVQEKASVPQSILL